MYISADSLAGLKGFLVWAIMQPFAEPSMKLVAASLAAAAAALAIQPAGHANPLVRGAALGGAAVYFLNDAAHAYGNHCTRIVRDYTKSTWIDIKIRDQERANGDNTYYTINRMSSRNSNFRHDAIKNDCMTYSGRLTGKVDGEAHAAYSQLMRNY